MDCAEYLVGLPRINFQDERKRHSFFHGTSIYTLRDLLVNGVFRGITSETFFQHRADLKSGDTYVISAAKSLKCDPRDGFTTCKGYARVISYRHYLCDLFGLDIDQDHLIYSKPISNIDLPKRDNDENVSCFLDYSGYFGGFVLEFCKDDDCQVLRGDKADIGELVLRHSSGNLPITSLVAVTPIGILAESFLKSLRDSVGN